MERDCVKVKTPQSPRSLNSSRILNEEIINALSQKQANNTIRKPFLDKVKDIHTQQAYHIEVSLNAFELKRAFEFIKLMNNLQQNTDTLNQSNLDNE